MSFTIVVLCSIMAIQGAAADTTEPAAGLPDEAIETFLREAEVIELKEFASKGITRPKRAVLSDGEQSLRAAFKDVDELHVKWETADGRYFLHVIDSYRNEIASYELDKLLGLGLVPPTVERTIDGDTGSLQLWLEGAKTEWQRKKVEKLSPPDMEAWNNQVSTIKLYLQLVWDTDFNNISNVMVGPDWKIWKIDSSRAFYTKAKLRNEDSLTRFSRGFLNALEDLDRDQLDQTLGPWLSKRQIKTLLQRRNRILELAEERVAEFGEDSVLYD